jgi:hypothetical protein
MPARRIGRKDGRCRSWRNYIQRGRSPTVLIGSRTTCRGSCLGTRTIRNGLTRSLYAGRTSRPRTAILTHQIGMDCRAIHVVNPKQFVRTRTHNRYTRGQWQIRGAALIVGVGPTLNQHRTIQYANRIRQRTIGLCKSGYRRKKLNGVGGNRSAIVRINHHHIEGVPARGVG